MPTVAAGRYSLGPTGLSSDLICRSRSDCADAAKIDQKRRATLTKRRRVAEACQSCKHGWLAGYRTSQPGQRGCGGGNSSCRPRASSSAHSVAAGPVKIDHPVDVPRRIERPGVVASATPTASCVSLCESCGLMRIPLGGWVCVAGLRRF